MLQGVVDDGSVHFAQISGYTVGGKTGTSQKVDPRTGTYGSKYVAMGAELLAAHPDARLGGATIYTLTRKLRESLALV